MDSPLQVHLYVRKHRTEGDGKVGATPSDVFDLCSDLILEIHSFVHPIPTAPWQTFNFCVCPRVVASSNS